MPLGLHQHNLSPEGAGLEWRVDILGLKLTDFNGRRLVCGAVHGWAAGGFVFPCERELGNRGSAEEGDGEGGQQHVNGRIMWSMFRPTLTIIHWTSSMASSDADDDPAEPTADGKRAI